MFNPQHIENRNGDTVLRRGTVRRLSRETVTYLGVDFEVHFDVDGSYVPATATDPAEYPLCCIRKIEIGGQDCTRLFDNSAVLIELAERVEAMWRAET